ncbi:hypothetical protein ACP4OV_030651 [Aristida adscensionis]
MAMHIYTHIRPLRPWPGVAPFYDERDAHAAPPMDAIFTLAAAPRARVLERAASRVPGCLYACLWAPVIAGHLPSSHLFCLDAWIGVAGGGGGGDRARAAFEAYRGAFCAVVSGDGAAYMELPELDLSASASLPVQQQFYHEAGTKMAVFMGCESGEIEIGLSTSTSPAAVPDHFQQSLLEELLQLPPTGPSSSSSSLPSLSIGSPEYSSLIRSIAMSAAPAGEPSSSQPAAQLHGMSYAPAYGHATLPSAEAADAAMAQAMLAVISSTATLPSTTTPAAPPPSSSPRWLARHRARRSSPRRGAFRPYGSALSPRAPPPRRPGAPGQRMIKTAIALMVSVHMAMRDRELAAARHEEGAAAAAAGGGSALPPPAPQPSSSQLHHMISERRRRERLNDSFQTLRSLLPPGSKKDKATVLADTTEYMMKLIAQVSELEKKNRQLEAQLGQADDTQLVAGDDSTERVHVDVTAGASTSTSTPNHPQEVSVKVTVRAECDVSELVVALLAGIKGMERFAVVTVDARQAGTARAQVGITLRRVAPSDEELDEASLKEAVAKVVEDAVARSPPSPP